MSGVGGGDNASGPFPVMDSAFDIDIEDAGFRGGGVSKVGKNRGLAEPSEARNAERRERIRENDPGRDRSNERLGGEGSQRDIFERLDVAC